MPKGAWRRSPTPLARRSPSPTTPQTTSRLSKTRPGAKSNSPTRAAGDLETVTDALAGVTKYAYDSQHRLTSITDPRGNVILKNIYNGEGRITEQEDGLKNLWKLEYKPGETIVTEPAGRQTQIRLRRPEPGRLGNRPARPHDDDQLRRSRQRPRSHPARRGEMDLRPRRSRQPHLGQRPRRRRTKLRIRRPEPADQLHRRPRQRLELRMVQSQRSGQRSPIPKAAKRPSPTTNRASR